MKKFFCVTSLLIAITSLGSSVVQAQSSSPTQGPNGAPAPDRLMTPSPMNTPDSTTSPAAPDSGSGVPGSTTPDGAANPTNTNTSQSVCSSALVGSNTASDSVYTAGPVTPQQTASGSNLNASPGTNNSSSSSYDVRSTYSSGTGVGIGGGAGGSVLTQESSATRRYTAVGLSNPNAAQIIKTYSDEVEYNNLVNTPQNIELYVGSSPLCYVNITPLNDVSVNDNIRVRDKSGQELGITVTKQENGGARVVFSQPVPAGRTIKIGLQEVNYFSSLTPTAVLYSLAGGHIDFNQEIPYGVARLERFRR